MASRIRKAVFPVAGLGTRMLPATKSVPKELLPVGRKPLIQHAVEEAQEAGIEEFIFITGCNKKALEDHFDLALELQNHLLLKDRDISPIISYLPPAGNIAYIRQGEPLGLGHAVWCARHLIRDEPFAVLCVDDLVHAKDACLKQMIQAYRKHGGYGGLVAVENVDRNDTHRYGIIDTDNLDTKHLAIRDMVEKPIPQDAPSTLAIIGRYILPAEIFTSLGEIQAGANGEIQLTDAISRLLKDMPFHGFRFDGERFDCGSWEGWLAANMAYAFNDETLKDSAKAVVKRYALP